MNKLKVKMALKHAIKLQIKEVHVILAIVIKTPLIPAQKNVY